MGLIQSHQSIFRLNCIPTAANQASRQYKEKWPKEFSTQQVNRIQHFLWNVFRKVQKSQRTWKTTT